MKKLLSLLFLYFSFYNALQAQDMYFNHPNGSPLRLSNYVDIQGTPYLYDNWLKSEVTLKNGKTFKDVELRYDIVNDELLFKDAKGQVMAFTDPVMQFTFNDTKESYISNISGLKGFTDKSYFQVFNEGKVKILKKRVKTITEERAYNSATTTKSFVENAQYFLVGPSGTAVPLKREEKFILSVLQDKADQLKEYIHTKKLNLKKDPDLIDIIDYYNSLPA